MAGLFAVDVVTLARLAQITGPMDVPGYGRSTADNLVETLVGSYDRFTDAAERKAANRALVPLFMDRLLEPGELPEKARVLIEAARGRHFAAYFRDHDSRTPSASMALTGDLSDTEHDYLGVFTQNVIASKTDYWQRRRSADVRLRDRRQRAAVGSRSDPQRHPALRRRRSDYRGRATSPAGPPCSRHLPARRREVDPREVDGRAGRHGASRLLRPPLHAAADHGRPPPGAAHEALEYDVPAAAVARVTAADLPPRRSTPRAWSTRRR